MSNNNDVVSTFRSLWASADRKFTRTRDLPTCLPRGTSSSSTTHLLHKAFKSHTKLWKYQQTHRTELVNSGVLTRPEIGEIASRIGQLYYGQYVRTSEARFLYEACIFYEAVFSRGYFEGEDGSNNNNNIKERGLRFKEMRFFARFLVVVLLLDRKEMVGVLVARFENLLADSVNRFRACIFYEAVFSRGYFQGDGNNKEKYLRFKETSFFARFLVVVLLLDRREMVGVLVTRFEKLLDDSVNRFRETNFKEWKLVLQEIMRFLKADIRFSDYRPLRYCPIFDTHPSSFPFVARFHAKKLVKFRDAVLTSYHRNEVKFAELTLDTFRMLQSLEWEPSGSFFQKQQEALPRENGAPIDYSASSGLININLAADMTDPNLPPNPRKAILYRPLVTHLIAVIATICEELPSESVLLIHISASGKDGHGNVSQKERSVAFSKSLNTKVHSHTSQGKKSSLTENHVSGKGNSVNDYEDGLWLGPSKNGGPNWLYPGDIIPFTRKPLFIVIDSDNSHAFKVLHGAERGETAALLLSPLKPTVMKGNLPLSGSQFTLFLTDPLQAFCQLVGISCSKHDPDFQKVADKILSTNLAQLEVILCKSTILDLVWAQVLPDPFLRRLILRFIFCRSVLALSCREEDSDKYLPICLPELPDFVSPTSDVVQSCVFQLASHFDVSDCFSN